MKTRSSLLAVTFATGLVALTFSGCSTFDRTAGPSANKPIGGKSMELVELRDEVKATRASLDRTIESLNLIPDSPASRDSYADFSVDLATFRKDAKRTIDKSTDVRNRSRELFAEWNIETQSINNPEIRNVAEERRTTLEQSYKTMVTPLVTARTDLAAVRSDLVDVQKALALDLTRPGISAVRPSIEEINRKAETSRRSLDALAAELDKIASTLPAQTVTRVTQVDE